MQMRLLLPCGSLLALFIVLCYFYPRVQAADRIGDFTEWTPTPRELAHAVGTGAEGRFDDARHRAFARMFKNRFRDHLVAVGFRFTGPDRARLLCAAMIPRWDMARIGVQAYHEVRNVFGKACKIDIYETYISLRSRKIAEVRPIPGASRLAVTFRADYPQEIPSVARRRPLSPVEWWRAVQAMTPQEAPARPYIGAIRSATMPRLPVDARHASRL